MRKDNVRKRERETEREREREREREKERERGLIEIMRKPFLLPLL